MGEAVQLTKRPLGRTGLEVSPLTLAAMSVHLGMPGKTMTPECVEAAYHEYGINTFFVTTLMKPLVEGIRRLVRAGHRDKLVIISVASLPAAPLVPRSWTNQVRALECDTIDCFLLGWVQARWWLSGGAWNALEQLRDAGKVRAIGYSAHDRLLAMDLAREYAPDVLMIRYNASHRGAEHEVFEPLKDQRPGMLTYTATRWDMLLRPLPHAGFPEAMTASECYRFALSHPAVDTVLCAPRTIEELAEDAAGSLAGPLDGTRMEEVQRFGDAVQANLHGGHRWMFRQG